MPVYNYDNVERDGADRMIKLAKALCFLVQTFSVILRAKYGDNIAIMALLTAIEGLCPLIPDAEYAAIQWGGDNSDPLADPTEIPGINPGLPPASAPDIT